MSLGRGLGSLIPTKTIKQENTEVLVETGEMVLQVLVDQIEANPDQPRKDFSRLAMEELINSIRERGIIQPLILVSKETLYGDSARQTEINENIKYQIIAGERRWRAAKILELKTVPAIVRSFSNNEKLEISLLENIQRQDLNPMERAWAYQRLIDEFNLTQEQVSERLGKARATVANTLRLLILPEIIQSAIAEGRITESHAKALLSLDDEEKQKMFLKRILGLGLTVRETEKAIMGKKTKPATQFQSEFLEQEKLLAVALEAKISIAKQNKSIKIIIEAGDEQGLEKIIKKITKQV